MEIRFLGTRSLSLERPESLAILVEAGSVRFLVECGPYVVLQLTQAGIPVETLSGAFVSHEHSDHGGGLPYLLFAAMMRRFLGHAEKGAGFDIVLPGREKSALLRYCMDTYPLIFGKNPLFEVEATDGPRCTIGGELGVECFPLTHAIDNWGIVCTHGDKRFCYVSDTIPREGLAERARGSDILVCSVLGPEKRRPMAEKLKFLTGRDAGQLAREASVRRLALMHVFYEEEAEQCREEAAGEYEGEILLPSAGDVLTL